MQVSFGGDQHDPCRGEVEKVHASGREEAQQVGRIEVVERTVGRVL